MRCLVTGGSGFIGRHLVSRLDHPIVLGRDRERIIQQLGEIDARQWNPAGPIDPEIFNNINTVFHLAGESVSSGRWNAARKKRIVESRLKSTRTIIQAMAELDRPPKTLLCASAIGYYGNRGNEQLTESSNPGSDFLAEVCIAWEKEAREAENLGIRVVIPRIGVVLGKDGGALPQMLPPFKRGIGGRLGSGRQYMSWIHIDDMVGILLHMANNENMQGPYNAVTPQPVTNSEFTAALAKALHRPAFLPVPAFALRTALGQFAEVLLSSQKVIPQRTIQSGYNYSFPQLQSALANLLYNHET